MLEFINKITHTVECDLNIRIFVIRNEEFMRKKRWNIRGKFVRI